MSLVRPITRADIKGPALYAGMRDDFRRHIIGLKKPRRIVIGDRVSLVFENRHTLTLQIEEMLRAESITRDEQIREEIEVYNQMMPTADSLSATLFVELPPDADPVIELRRLVGLDEHVFLRVGSHTLRAAFEPGRSTDDKISAVQYVRFPLEPGDVAALSTPGTPVRVEIDHPHYRASATLAEGHRASLAADLAP